MIFNKLKKRGNWYIETSAQAATVVFLKEGVGIYRISLCKEESIRWLTLDAQEKISIDCKLEF